MKITDTFLLLRSLSMEYSVNSKISRPEVVIPSENENEEPKTIIITADALQIRMDKERR